MTKISLKVHMKEQLFKMTFDHCEEPRIAIQVQNNNKSTWMQMRCSPSLWSSFFIFLKISLLHFISPYHSFPSPPLTMESSTILSTKRTMQIERKAKERACMKCNGVASIFEFFNFWVQEALEITQTEQTSIFILTQGISSLSALARSCKDIYSKAKQEGLK